MKLTHGVPTVLALVLGGLVLLALGKWDGMVSARDAQTIREARAVLKAGKGYRARLAANADTIAGLRATVGALEGRERRQRAALDSLRAVEAAGTYAGATGPVDSVAGSLGLQVHPDGWLADSGTVRHLARLAWRSDVRLPAAESLAVTLDSLWRANAALVEVYAVRAALAEARVTALETSLAATLRIADCRILGFIKCPSRTVTLVVGLGLGGVGGYLAARE